MNSKLFLELKIWLSKVTMFYLRSIFTLVWQPHTIGSILMHIFINKNSMNLIDFFFFEKFIYITISFWFVMYTDIWTLRFFDKNLTLY